jgi:hypothetical protein
MASLRRHQPDLASLRRHRSDPASLRRHRPDPATLRRHRQEGERGAVVLCGRGRGCLGGREGRRRVLRERERVLGGRGDREGEGRRTSGSEWRGGAVGLGGRGARWCERECGVKEKTLTACIYTGRQLLGLAYSCWASLFRRRALYHAHLQKLIYEGGYLKATASENRLFF